MWNMDGGCKFTLSTLFIFLLYFYFFFEHCADTEFKDKTVQVVV